MVYEVANLSLTTTGTAVATPADVAEWNNLKPARLPGPVAAIGVLSVFCVGAVHVSSAEPVADAHVRVNAVLANKLLTTCDPLVAFTPVQPPLAVQLEDSVEDHVSTTLKGLMPLVGDPDRVTVGALQAMTGVIARSNAKDRFIEPPITDRSGK